MLKAGSLPPLESQCGSKACPRWRWHIQHRCKLTHRHREQAQLPQGICAEGRISTPLENQCGSKACPRWRWHIQHRCKLTHRHREQAQLPQGFVVKAGSLPPLESQCGSKACPRWRWHIQHRCKLTHRHREQAQLPQGICGEGRISTPPRESMWEQGLPAMAVAHSTSLQADPPPSRASSAPTEDLC